MSKCHLETSLFISDLDQAGPRERYDYRNRDFSSVALKLFSVCNLFSEPTFQLISSWIIRTEECCNNKSWYICLIWARAMKQADIKFPFFLPSIFPFPFSWKFPAQFTWRLHSETEGQGMGSSMHGMNDGRSLMNWTDETLHSFRELLREESTLAEQLQEGWL